MKHVKRTSPVTRTARQLSAAACLLLALCLTLPALSGCASDGNPADKTAARIVTTTFPAADIVRNLCAGAFDCPLQIVTLNTAGDLHGYEPNVRDMAEISGADLLVCVGGVSESWLDSTLSAVRNQNLTVLRMTDCVKMVEEEVPEGAETGAEEGTEVEYDEHVWTSLKNMADITDAVASALCGLYPDSADAFRANAEAYKGQLSSLESEYRAVIDASSLRCLIIADRYPFTYMMKDLGLTCYAAFPGCSSETNASFSTQVFLIEKARQLGVTVILQTDNAAGSCAGAVASEIGGRVLTLYSGQYWPADENTGYIDLMRANLDVLRQALSAPEGKPAAS